MTPLSFDLATAREVTKDARVRSIEAKARLDADAGVFDPPADWPTVASYWGKVQHSLELIVYAQQYKKRSERNQRKSFA